MRRSLRAPLFLAGLAVVAMTCACKKEPVERSGQAVPATPAGGAAGATSQAVGKDLSESAAGEPFVLKLEREQCYGFCPAYTIEIDADGTVRYVGRRHVAVRGPRTWHVDRAAVAALVEEVASAGFFTMTWKDPCDQVHTDDSTATTTAIRQGRKRTLRDYHGDSCVPRQLRDLEDAIDRVAGTAAVIKCDGDSCDH